jgi:hypothetical protein
MQVIVFISGMAPECRKVQQFLIQQIHIKLTKHGIGVFEEIVEEVYFRCFGSRRGRWSLSLCRDPGRDTGSSVWVKSVSYVSLFGARVVLVDRRGGCSGCCGVTGFFRFRRRGTLAEVEGCGSLLSLISSSPSVVGWLLAASGS